MSKWIDAEWLLNFFEPYPNDYQTPLGLLRACVDDAPSIDIESKRGEWIVEIDANGYTYGRCSICGTRQYAGQLNFCPDCGARMKGADDE